MSRVNDGQRIPQDYDPAVPVDALTEHPDNPRRGDVEALDTSMRQHGFYGAVYAQKSTGRIVAGNHRHRVAVSRGEDTLPVIWLDVDDDQARRILLVDNRSADLGGYDDGALEQLLGELHAETELGLLGTGYTIEDLHELRGTDPDPGPAGAGDDDGADEVPVDAPAITVRGDVWLLGPHRVMCGDCRDAGDVTTALDGRRVTVAFTSPPYASQRTYDEASEFKPIRPDEYVEWFRAVASNVAAVLTDDGSWFVNIKDHAEQGVRHRYVLDLFVDHLDHGWLRVDGFIWPRPAFPIDPHNAGRFKNGWEPVEHFTRGPGHKFRPDAVMVESDAAFTYDAANRMQGNQTTGFLGVGRDASTKGKGLAYPSNVLPMFGVAASGTDHPAAFPVALPEWFVKAYSDEGDVVFDPFMGSGSTLIAAHRQDRVAVGMEISPRYTDVICHRWQLLTGDKPVLGRTGEAHDFTADTEG